MLRFLTSAHISPALSAQMQNAGLFLLRLGAGGTMLAAHGWSKLTGFGEKASSFPDPLGVGNELSLALAVGAEFFCSILLVIGAVTRFALFPLMITMAVAAFIIHAADPFQKKELALIYLLIFTTLFLTGPGKFSFDEWWKTRTA